jgi:predicted hexulose-6-phosphate isomerase
MAEYKLGLYEKSMPGTLSLREKLAAAKDAGFDYLEFSIDETDEKLARLDWSDAQINDARHATEETGVPIASICLSGHRRFPLGDPDPDARKRGLEIMDKAITLAARLGVRIIQLAGYDVYYKEGNDETRALFGENLATSTLLAAASGVMLGFETMETPFLNTVQKAMYWVNKIDSPYLGVYPDLGNITNAVDGDTAAVSADIASGKGHIMAMHLKETKPGIYREVPYGEGRVDFPAGVRAAWALGVRRYTGEFWYTKDVGDRWAEVLRHNAEFLRGKIEG